ncbi:MAG TPA: Yip1 family protein [Burkholderiales bacterium]|nr:Yip1 family protein [Burkholderiales bacterium]
MNAVNRAANILLEPQNEWAAIAHERSDPKALYLGYIAILAILPAAATLISTWLVGSLGFGRLGARVALQAALTGYVLSLAMVLAIALVANLLAPRFGGRSNFDQALKLTAYALTASWVAGIFTILPVVGWLVSLLGGLYSLYLLQVGAPQLMKMSERDAVGYGIALVAIGVVITFLIGGAIAATFGMGAIGMMGAIGRF